MSTDDLVQLPSPTLPPGPRRALIIATSRYEDQSLSQLRSPVRDAEDFKGVLEDENVGGFDVAMRVDEDATEMHLSVSEFVQDCDPSETILVYLSCHGIPDKQEDLYLAATNTKRGHLSATAVKAADLLKEMRECRARRKIVVLDCCYSGSFANHKGEADPGRRLAAHSRGLEILTSSRSYERSLDGTPGSEVPGSIFTVGLVDGLRTGKADSGKVGLITVEDAFDYASNYVRGKVSDQNPQRSLYFGEGGGIVLARSVAGRYVAPAKLPGEWMDNLESGHPEFRIAAVRAIAKWLGEEDDCRVISAVKHLTRVVEEDMRRVSAEAISHLNYFFESEVGAPYGYFKSQLDQVLQPTGVEVQSPLPVPSQAGDSAQASTEIEEEDTESLQGFVTVFDQFLAVVDSSKSLTDSGQGTVVLLRLAELERCFGSLAENVTVATCPDVRWAMKVNEAVTRAQSGLRRFQQDVSGPRSGQIPGRRKSDLDDLSHAVSDLRKLITGRYPAISPLGE